MGATCRDMVENIIRGEVGQDSRNKEKSTEAAKTPQNPKESHESQELKEFHKFSVLPKELRLLIWNQALEDLGKPRTLEIMDYCRIDGGLWNRWYESDTRQDELLHAVERPKIGGELGIGDDGRQIYLPAGIIQSPPLALVNHEAKSGTDKVYRPIRLGDLFPENLKMNIENMDSAWIGPYQLLSESPEYFNLARDTLCIRANGKAGALYNLFYNQPSYLGRIEQNDFVKMLCDEEEGMLCNDKAGNPNSLYGIERLEVKGVHWNWYEERKTELEDRTVWESMIFQFVPNLKHLVITPDFGQYRPEDRVKYEEILAKMKAFFQRNAAREYPDVISFDADPDGQYRKNFGIEDDRIMVEKAPKFKMPIITLKMPKK